MLDLVGVSAVYNRILLDLLFFVVMVASDIITNDTTIVMQYKGNMAGIFLFYFPFFSDFRGAQAAVATS